MYRARDTKLGRNVAFKILPMRLHAILIGSCGFRREAHALAWLKHPATAAIYELEESDGKTALVLELAEGRTLAERLSEQSSWADSTSTSSNGLPQRMWTSPVPVRQWVLSLPYSLCFRLAYDARIGSPAQPDFKCRY